MPALSDLRRAAVGHRGSTRRATTAGPTATRPSQSPMARVTCSRVRPLYPPTAVQRAAMHDTPSRAPWAKYRGCGAGSSCHWPPWSSRNHRMAVSALVGPATLCAAALRAAALCAARSALIRWRSSDLARSVCERARSSAAPRQRARASWRSCELLLDPMASAVVDDRRTGPMRCAGRDSGAGLRRPPNSVERTA